MRNNPGPGANQEALLLDTPPDDASPAYLAVQTMRPYMDIASYHSALYYIIYYYYIYYYMCISLGNMRQ